MKFRLAAALLMPLLLCACAKQPAAQIVLRAVDGWTDEPLPGAVFALPEGGAVGRADGDGCAVFSDVPVVPDASFASILPQENGTVTVLAYCDGYCPCALLRVCVYARETRRLTVRLFPDDGTMAAPFVLTESPEEAWLRALLKKWEPAAEPVIAPVQLG